MCAIFHLANCYPQTKYRLRTTALNENGFGLDLGMIGSPRDTALFQRLTVPGREFGVVPLGVTPFPMSKLSAVGFRYQSRR